MKSPQNIFLCVYSMVAKLWAPKKGTRIDPILLVEHIDKVEADIRRQISFKTDLSLFPHLMPSVILPFRPFLANILIVITVIHLKQWFVYTCDTSDIQILSFHLKNLFFYLKSKELQLLIENLTQRKTFFEWKFLQTRNENWINSFR